MVEEIDALVHEVETILGPHSNRVPCFVRWVHGVSVSRVPYGGKIRWAVRFTLTNVDGMMVEVGASGHNGAEALAMCTDEVRRFARHTRFQLLRGSGIPPTP